MEKYRKVLVASQLPDIFKYFLRADRSIFVLDSQPIRSFGLISLFFSDQAERKVKKHKPKLRGTLNR